MFIPLVVLSQSWQKSYDITPSFFDNIADIGHSIKETNDGGYILLSSSGAMHNIWIVKIQNNGNIQWEKNNYGSFPSPTDIQQTSDGGYVFCGGYDYAWLIKTDMFGNVTWNNTYDNLANERVYSVKETLDGGYVACGRSGNGSVTDAYVIKTDINGDTLWTRTFGSSTYFDVTHSILQSSDGGYAICGTTDNPVTDQDVWLIKTDMYGDTIWTKSYNSVDTVTFWDTQGWHTIAVHGSDIGYSVKQTNDGGYIITGTTTLSPGIVNSNGSFFGEYSFLIKTDGNGDLVWMEYYGSSNSHMISSNSVEQTNDGGYIFTGSCDPYISNNYSAYLIKTDINGSQECMRTYSTIHTNSNHDATGNSVRNTSDGGYIMIGKTQGIPPEVASDIFVVKVDSNGPCISTSFPNINRVTRRLLKVTDVLGREVNKKRNTPLFYIYNDGTVEKKIIIK
jgi:hypothetical protein